MNCESRVRLPLSQIKTKGISILLIPFVAFWQKLGKIAVLFSFCVLGKTKHF